MGYWVLEWKWEFPHDDWMAGMDWVMLRYLVDGRHWGTLCIRFWEVVGYLMIL
jgi:hypothetical protein